MPPKKVSRVAFIGRFQPFHRGHLSVLQDLLEEFDQVLVVIGSSDKFRTLDNPFTVGERHAMVKATMDALKIAPDRYKVIPLPDIGDDEKWVKHVMDTCPEFDTVASGNPKVQELFRKIKKKKVIEPKQKYRITATGVREAIRNGEDLKKYLHEAVVAFLQKIGAARKIIDIEEAEKAAEAVVE
jgi:nicotinamide-nucleotide adenylyltransferase